ncbi:MAG: hypothetical protein RIQ34_1669, partial [Bacteroidota bacterium]
RYLPFLQESVDIGPVFIGYRRVAIEGKGEKHHCDQTDQYKF